MIESRCGILCSECEWKEKTGCKGCVSIDKPFWGDSCPVKACCEGRGKEHCGGCGDFACGQLNGFSYDKEHGDNGKRIEQCKQWSSSSGGVKAAVIYRSMTGHSKKLAKAIAAEIGAEAQDAKSNPEINNVDLLFIVGGIYGGKSLPEMLQYVKGLTAANVKKAVLITSSTSDKKGQDDIREILTSNGIEVAAEEYRCRGNFLIIKLGHPNKKEITEAAQFAKKFL